MPQQTIYIRDEDADVWAQAVALGGGASLSQVVTTALREYIERRQQTTQIYWTPALPSHYVAVKPDGSKWLIPVAPIGSQVWSQAKPYQGSYTLERLCPPALERQYQPEE